MEKYLREAYNKYKIGGKMIPFVCPEFMGKTFNCPHCGAYSQQRWWEFCRADGVGGHEGLVGDVQIAYCIHCRKYSLWREEKMIYPSGGAAPLPNNDLPEDIKKDYEEARAIVALSPRGAAALLRLAIQKLCAHLGEKGKNINDDIASLVKKGLPVKIQKALDIVRVVGNGAVHPGQIDLKDDEKTASELFSLINLIAEVMITQPKSIDALYDKLPENKKTAIDDRDK
ncbi:DUF4145 domain-containing protein [Candidatus Omnitrophota bacterium]